MRLEYSSPLVGWQTRPAGLWTTRRSASSWRMANSFSKRGNFATGNAESAEKKSQQRTCVRSCSFHGTRKKPGFLRALIGADARPYQFLFHQAAGKFINARQAFFDVGHAGRVA